MPLVRPTAVLGGVLDAAGMPMSTDTRPSPWLLAATTALEVGAPILGNILLPGVGGIIGGAVGGIASAYLTGDIHDGWDVALAAGAGGAGALIGGACTIRASKGVAKLFGQNLPPFKNLYRRSRYLVPATVGAGQGFGTEVAVDQIFKAKDRGWYSSWFESSVVAGLAVPAPSGPVPTIDIGTGVFVSGMPRLLMPGPQILSTGVETYYRQLPDLLVKDWETFGADTKTSVPPSPQVLDVAGPERARIANYAQRVEQLKTAFDALQQADIRLAGLVKQSADASIRGRKAISNVITTLTDRAPQGPPSATGQDDWTTQGILDAVTAAEKAMREAGETLTKVADSADRLTEKIEKPSEIHREPEKTPDKSGEKESEPPDKTQAETVDTEQPAVEPDRRPSTVMPPITIERPAEHTPPAPNKNDTVTQPPSPPRPLPNKNTVAPVRAHSVAPPPITSWDRPSTPPRRPDRVGPTETPTLSPSPRTPWTGADPLTTALPVAMMMMAAGHPPNPHPKAEHNPDPSRAPQHNTEHKHPNTTSPHQQPPPTTTTPPDRTPPPPSPPEEPILYTYPDGRSQYLARTVTRALDKAFAATGNTNAHDAYTDTPAQWSATGQPGTPVDTNQLTTGDIAAWKNATAIIVNCPPNTIETIIDGKTTPLTPHQHQRFGEFIAFFHPHNIPTLQPHPTPGITETAIPA